MRLDRIIALLLSRCINNTDPAILMYHSLDSVGVSHNHPYFGVITTPQRFKEQMEYIVKNNFTVMTAKEMINKWMVGEKIPRHTVVITFDDGFSDVYTTAFPIMQKLGLRATVFMPTNYIGEKNGLEGRSHLNWNQIRELHGHGIEIGSHSVRHQEMSQLSLIEIENEWQNSASILADGLGVKITSAAHPYAFPEANRAYVEVFTKIIQQCGYDCCLCTRIGTTSVHDQRFAMKRLPVNEYDDNSLLQAKIRGAYNYVYYIQSFVKVLKQYVQLTKINNTQAVNK